MNDWRALINGRHYLSTFICGARYVTVLHSQTTLEEIRDAIEEHLGELKKPFVIVSQNLLYEGDFHAMVDSELTDIVLEN